MLTKTETRLAAEAIACNAWERGASAGGVAEAIERAFRRDAPRVQEAAQRFAARWLERAGDANKP